MKDQDGIPADGSWSVRPKSYIPLLTVVLVSAALGFWWSVFNTDREMREEFIEHARLVSNSLVARDIASLTASDADLTNPVYLSLKSQMDGIRRAVARNHFVYLLRQRPDGTVVFLADSEPSTSKDYSPPGQEYGEVPDAIRRLFASGAEAAVGPYTDRWGRWVSAVVPIIDHGTGRTVALLGMDSDVRIWNRRLAMETAESLSLVLVFIAPFAVYIMQRRKTEQRLRQSRDEWQNTFDSMPDLITILDTEHRIIRANRAMCRKLELDGAPLIGRHCYHLVHQQDSPPDYCPHARLLADGQPHTEEATVPVLGGDYSVSVTPLYDAAGTLIGSIHIAHDITQQKLAEQSLHDSEERYRMLFNEAQIGICLADAETGIIIDTNQAMADLTGRPVDELTGLHQKMLHPARDDDAPFSESFIKHRETAVGSVQPDRIITASGDIRDVEIKSQAFILRGRQVLLGIFYDVTERKRAEEALRESKEHYQALYRLIRLMCDNVPDLIWAKDLEKRYIFANKAMCEVLLGAEDTEEPIGRDDMYFALRQRGSKPGRSDWHTFGELCMDSDSIVMSAREPGHFDESGNIKGSLLHLDVTKAPFLDEHGTMIGTVGCGRDVTRIRQLEEEHRHAEKRLQFSEERLKRAEEMAHLGHWSLDLKTNTQFWSDEMFRVYGVSPESFKPTFDNIFSLVHPDDHEARRQSYAAIKRDGKGSVGYRVVRPDGQQRIIIGSGELLYNEAGEPETIFGIILDITELRRKEAELHQKNAEMERFIYTVSHDLRSPLVTIKTFLGYLGQDLVAGPPERVEQDVAYINGAADKMRQLLDDLIEMSRVGRIGNAHTSFTFRELINEALVIVAGQLSATNIEVRVQESAVTFYGDRARLVEVWQNLLDNAAKYIGDRQERLIEIGVDGSDRDCIFFVRDNGIGIDPEHAGKIFGLFEKLDSSSEGTGLGLTLIKRIVETNGGRIWVESAGAGRGSCFRFTLPDAVCPAEGGQA